MMAVNTSNEEADQGRGVTEPGICIWSFEQNCDGKVADEGVRQDPREQDLHRAAMSRQRELDELPGRAMRYGSPLVAAGFPEPYAVRREVQRASEQGRSQYDNDEETPLPWCPVQAQLGFGSDQHDHTHDEAAVAVYA